MKTKNRERPGQSAGLSTSLASGLSFISSIVVAGILGFFVDALRRAYMPVPWPILLVMSASCISVTALLLASLTRCFFPTSVVLQLLFHSPIAALWIVAVALLGNELSEHLARACPSSDTLGNDLALVCHLFKALFAFAILSTVCSLCLVVLDIRDVRLSKKTAKYSAMEANTGVVASQIARVQRKEEGNLFTKILKRKGENNVQEDERSIMMTTIYPEDKQNDILKPGTNSPSQQFAVPSPEWGPRERIRVQDARNMFEGHDTQYDPGR